MRALRTLAAAGLAVSLLAIPALSTAQSEVAPESTPYPLARQPDGQLPLEGTPWRLVSYTDGQREGVPGPEVAAFIEFGPGFFDGSGGCSRVRGQYSVVGPAMSAKLRKLGERDCAENLTIVQMAVESGLKKAAAYEIEPGTTPAQDELVIYSVVGDELLRYGLDDLSLLEGTEWRLESYTVGGVAVAASDQLRALISFLPQSDSVYKRRQSGPISGTSGCNGIVADFYRHADVLSFSELELTDAPCTEELAAQETAMTAVLDATAIGLDLPHDRLVLTSADTSERLEFMSQTPLEGTTWWLRGTAAEGSVGAQRITLRLEDGFARGEGPCGPYSASYVTDGAFISFGDVRGARAEECSEIKTERALVSGLRWSVGISRTAERLDFQDAGGDVTLSFDRPFAP